MTEASFERLLEYVDRELSFATTHYNDSYLDRRVSSRMRRVGCDDYDEYLDVLREDREERRALLDAFAINVTGFFRNPEVWDGVREILRERSRSTDRIAAWSAGCADGREPYSISMLARDDPGIDHDSLSVLATDINERALERARRGVYEATNTVDLDAELEYLEDYRAYVDVDGDAYRVREEVKRPVTFERHDLLTDEPNRGFDLVVCRNLFIYVDAAYKRPTVETLTRSLRPGGYLVIGKSETIPPSHRSVLTVVDGKRRIYRRDPE